jgi:membrane protein implicated in regulation of membrane protease activity
MSMLDFLETLFLRYGAWSWWVLGLVLLALELVMPGFVLVWFGLAALLVGVLALAVDWSVQTLALIWAAASVALLVTGRRWFMRDGPHSAEPLLNDRAGRLVGRIFTLAEPLGENGGTLHIDDGVWRIRGPVLPTGTRVVVRGSEGTTLIVAAAEEG